MYIFCIILMTLCTDVCVQFCRHQDGPTTMHLNVTISFRRSCVDLAGGALRDVVVNVLIQVSCGEF